MHRRLRSSQSGVALVMAMMIVALITVIAVEISWRFELSVSRSANRWAGVQAKAYIEGAEQLAMVALRQDALDEETNQADNLLEMWAQPSDPFPTDHGWVRGRLEDAHGRFNVNMLQPDSKSNTCPNGTPIKSGQTKLNCEKKDYCDSFTSEALLFILMLQTFNLGTEEEPEYLPFDQARGITEAVIDWLDDDNTLTGFGGAESDYYDSLEVPVAISNGEMVSISELQVIKGMPPILYKQLLPYVIALPKKDVNKININTTNIHVLRSLGRRDPCDREPHSIEDAQELGELLIDGDFRKEEDFFAELESLNGPYLNFINSKPWFDADLISIGQSEYFLFFSEVGIGDDHVRRGSTLLRRSGGEQGEGQKAVPRGEVNIEVVRRTDANF